uniref:Uncharacterized protein n=1 Tax=Myotis myotis TaxID=51298 RepID=A0A7J7UPE8_MYOMY|nr:hypothetical protein mMyoMyo1_008575 [Myotis myotis]
MAVNAEAGASRWRPSGLSSSSFPRPHSASSQPWTPGGDGCRDGPPSSASGRKPRGSRREEAWVFRTLFPAGIEFAGPRPLPATCGSARCPCRTSHALKIPIVSLSLSLCLGGVSYQRGTSVYSLNKSVLIIYYLPGMGMEWKIEELPALRELTVQWK